MDTKTKLDEAAVVPDLEQQPLLPPPPPPDTTADPKLTACSPESSPARDVVVASPGTSPATVRTLALVTATAGLAFAVDLAARREAPTLAAFAASFVIFCASSSLFAWFQGRGQREPRMRPRAWPATAAARVLFWSFAMSLVVSMTCWAADRPGVPRAAGSALSALGLVVCWLCLAEIAPFFGRVTVQISWGCRVRERRSEQGVAATSSEPQKRTQAN